MLASYAPMGRLSAQIDRYISASALTVVPGTIGIAGAAGFGVGLCPPANLPAGLELAPLGGERGYATFGNYIHALTGSVVVFVPKFYYRWNHLDNPSHTRDLPNDIDIKGVDTYATTAAAEAAGYRLHRAFIDGGAEQSGFFIDKYIYSKAAVGTGYTAVSRKDGLPLSTASTHNPIADLTASDGNYYYETLRAAKGRDSANGELNQNCPWFEMSVFIADALAKLSLAHGQAATSAANCAWYDSGAKNYPKGCNNNALRDTDDTTVIYATDGYTNCGRTGSGVPLAKTTHNGQECGVADVNGMMWQVAIGMTCVGGAKAITGVAKANPVRLTVAAHGLTTGTVAQVEGLVGPTTLNAKLYTITAVDVNTISLDGVDGTALPDYISGGTVYFGTFYLAKESVRMRDFTSGNTLATDHWGSTGADAMMDAIACPLPAPSGGVTRLLKMGNGANPAFSANALGDAGIPLSTGCSSTGIALFGADNHETYLRNELCVVGCGHWSYGSLAGVFARSLYSFRTFSSADVSGRAACYPV